MSTTLGLSVPGVYVQDVFSQPVAQSGAVPNRIAISGVGSWGPFNTPLFATDVPSAQLKIGIDDTHPNSMLSEVLTAIPECSNFVFSRVTDGSTDAPATMFLYDTAGTPGKVIALTAIYHGTDGNLITARLDLVSGTASLAPIYRLTVTGPTGRTEVYNNILGFGGFGGSTNYSATAFKANIMAALAGTLPGTVASQYLTASTAGASSTLAPQTGAASLQTGAGGANGTGTMTTALQLGVDGAQSRTGIYVFRRLIRAGTLILAGNDDPTAGVTLAAFAQSESCMALICPAVPGSTTDQVVAAIQANNIASRFLIAVTDWTVFKDPLQGYLQRTVTPLGAVAGVLASITPDIPPLNQPTIGKQGILGTERTISATGNSVLPVDDQEKAERTSNYIQWLGRPAPGGTAVYALWGLKASDGTPIADTRMLNWIALQIEALGGQFIGKKQSTSPTDKTRTDYANVVNAFLTNIATGASAMIADFQVVCDLTNNNAQSIQAGYLIATINVTTFSGVQYVLNVLQVGSQVTITHLPLAA